MIKARKLHLRALQRWGSDHKAAQRKELERVCAQIERGVDAILAGTAPAALKERLEELEQRKLRLEVDPAAAVAPAPRLHPGLAEVYHDRVARLTEALAGEDAVEVREVIRSLVEQIRLVPEDGRLRIEVRGELGAILRLAEGALNDKSPGCIAEALVCKLRRMWGHAATDSCLLSYAHDQAQGHGFELFALQRWKPGNEILWCGNAD